MAEVEATSEPERGAENDCNEHRRNSYQDTLKEIDPPKELTFLQIYFGRNEIMVAPDKYYFLIVIQNPTE
ncbi:dynein light chain roadblock-type 1-like protein [Leptotrombidium deliense]|uniref:Dynein light chain roadblock-type 1-like protein n=1 Tax=Leptotrombidium deliense TaxID=299467 RepID=A0A443RT29_9ACAR|nr:dynein light chain roadblock-type 1-like protein [Leptotrombidium deliense]